MYMGIYITSGGEIVAFAERGTDGRGHMDYVTVDLANFKLEQGVCGYKFINEPKTQTLVDDYRFQTVDQFYTKCSHLSEVMRLDSGLIGRDADKVGKIIKNAGVLKNVFEKYRAIPSEQMKYLDEQMHFTNPYGRVKGRTMEDFLESILDGLGRICNCPNPAKI